MDWGQLEDLREVGFEIGSHTANHVHLRGLGQEAYDAELSGSRRILEDRMQVPVESFAYPYGTHDEESVREVSLRYKNAVTTRIAFLGTDGDPHRLPRLDAYYVRGSQARDPVFAAASRVRLRARAALRRVRRMGAD